MARLSPVAVFREGIDLYVQRFPTLTGVYLPFVAFSLAIILPVVLLGGQAALTAASFIQGLFGMLFSIMLIQTIADSADVNQRMSDRLKLAWPLFLKFFLTVLLGALFIMGSVAIGVLSIGLLLSFFFAIKLEIVGAILAAILGLAIAAGAVYFGTMWSLSQVTCACERIRPLQALKRSFSLVRRKFAPVAGVLSLMILIAVIAMLPMFLFMALIANPVIRQTVSSGYSILSGLIITPLTAAITVVLYHALQKLEKEKTE